MAGSAPIMWETPIFTAYFALPAGGDQRPRATCRTTRNFAAKFSFPRSTPTRRAGSRSTRGTRCTGKPAATPPACRSSSCTAARAGAACRIIAATSIPSFWRIVLFDQRGAGRSTPCGEITDNTTQHLVADLERLRAHLGIDRWLLFGGSWGSTLALAYAEAYPERCLGLVLRGIFLARPSELDWFMHGMRNVFPEAWRAFCEFLPPAERGDLLGNYYRRLMHPDPAVHMPAAQAWDRYEGACSKLLPPTDPLPKFDSDASSLAIARIEAHYFVHQAFLSPTSSSRTSGASGTCRARSSRAATTSSARR